MIDGTASPEAVPPGAGPFRLVYSSYSPLEAHLICGMLQDAGIECVLGNEYIAAVEQPISNVTGGVRVLVRESQWEQATALLRDADTPSV